MFVIALTMLVRDRSKFLFIVMGVTLASMVITWQGSIFLGLMSRTVAVLTDMRDPDIWVMDPKVQYIDDVKPLSSTALYRVRGVEGVAWASPLYKGQTRARLANGQFQNCNLIGLEDSTLTGGPPRMLEGRLEDLRRADAVIVDAVGASTRLARPPASPGGSPEPLRVGDIMELNDRRAIVVGISQNTRTFQSLPTIYTTYARATSYVPRERKLLSFILVKAAPGEDIPALCDRLEQTTGLAAYTRDEFKGRTINYFIQNTGIPINFGIAVGLGFVIGTVITGFMFLSFTVDNLRYFGTLKAMGASDGRLLAMILLQAGVVGGIGYGLGVGIASAMGNAAANSPLAFYMPWQLLLVAGAATIVIALGAAMLAIRKVIALEPAIVFKG
ncbi:MAG: ABC transporter permease [Planctomycetota bacterium]|nr:ABC transporter permease [Planctomycetota bacterium]